MCECKVVRKFAGTGTEKSMYSLCPTDRANKEPCSNAYSVDFRCSYLNVARFVDKRSETIGAFAGHLQEEEREARARSCVGRGGLVRRRLGIQPCEGEDAGVGAFAESRRDLATTQLLGPQTLH